MIKLVCTIPFRGYQRGQEVTNPVLVAELLRTHDRHFVKTNHIEPEYSAQPVPPEPETK